MIYRKKECCLPGIRERAKQKTSDFKLNTPHHQLNCTQTIKYGTN